MESKDLQKYLEYREAVVSLRGTALSVKSFREQLKKELKFKGLRNAAREELQAIYDAVRRDLSLPKIPVWFPPRRKRSIGGRAKSIDDVPAAIVVYSISSPQNVPESQLTVGQVTISSKFEVFETLRHEIAHVIECHRHGFIDTHGPEFVTAYDEIGEYFRSHGYGALMKPL